MSGKSLRVMSPTSSDARFGGWMLSCKPLYFAFSKALCNVETLRGEHAFAFSVYVVDASYCDSVHFWESRVV